MLQNAIRFVKSQDECLHIGVRGVDVKGNPGCSRYFQSVHERLTAVMPALMEITLGVVQEVPGEAGYRAATAFRIGSSCCESCSALVEGIGASEWRQVRPAPR